MKPIELAAFCRGWSARLVRTSAALLVLGWSAAFALDPLPPPQGPVILIVSGDIEITNSDQGAQFDRDMLYALGKTVVETTTSWTDGDQVFEGV